MSEEEPLAVRLEVRIAGYPVTLQKGSPSGQTEHDFTISSSNAEVRELICKRLQETGTFRFHNSSKSNTLYTLDTKAPLYSDEPPLITFDHATRVLAHLAAQAAPLSSGRKAARS